MTPARAQANQPVEIHAIVSSDMMALAAHMRDCQRSHGALLPLVSALERVKGIASGHIVTTGALVGATALCLLLALR